MTTFLYAEPKMTDRTDEDLLTATARGDTQALDELFSRHFARAHRLAFRVLGDSSAAEDVAQTALLKIARSAERFERGSFGGYLYRVVVNEARNARKVQARREKHEQRAALARPEQTEGSPDLGLRVEEVNAAVSELEDDLRIPIILHYYEGLTHAEVATALSVPQGTAASRLRRGLEKLQESLATVAPLALTNLEESLRALGRSPVPTPHFVRPVLTAAKTGLAVKAASAVVAVALAAVVVTVATSSPPPPVGNVATTPPGVPVAPLTSWTAPTDPLPAPPLAVNDAPPPAPLPVRAAGHVFGPSNEPLAGMMVALEDTSFVASSDDAGAFEIRGPLPEKKETILTLVVRDPRRRLKGARKLIAEGEKNATLHLSRGCAVSGHVLDAKTKAPLAGVKLQAEKTGLAIPSYLTLEEDECVSGAEGEFWLGPLGGEEVRVVARKEGYAPTRTKPVTLSQTKTPDVTIELGAGIVFTGRVLDPEGHPLEHAVLGIYLGLHKEALITPENWLETECAEKAFEKFLGHGLDPDEKEKKLKGILGENAVYAETDAEGRFRFERLPLGKRSLVCVHFLYRSFRESVRLSGETVEETIRLEPGSEIEGLARKDDGSVATSGQVMAESQGVGGRVGEIGKDGHYKVVGLDGGMHTVLLVLDAEKMPDMKHMKTVEVPEKGSVHCDLGPEPTGARVVGRALKGGQAVSLGSAKLEPADGGSKAALVAMLEDEGRFVFTGVAPGRYTLVVGEGLGGGSHSVAITVPEGAGEVVQDLDLLRGSIAGRIDGEGQSGIAIAVRVETGMERFGVVWPDGNFEIDGVEAGSWWVRAARGSVGAKAVGPVTVAEGARVEGILLSVEKGEPFEVTVLDLDGEACPGAHAVLAPAGEAPVLAAGLVRLGTSDEPGNVRVASVANGKWDVWAFADGRAVGVLRGFEVANDARRATIKLGKPASLRVEVENAEGKPVAGAVLGLKDEAEKPLFVSPQGAGQGQFGPTSASGSATATLLPAGKVMVEARHGEKRGVATVELEAGREASVKVVVR